MSEDEEVEIFLRGLTKWVDANLPAGWHFMTLTVSPDGIVSSMGNVPTYASRHLARWWANTPEQREWEETPGRKLQ